MNKGLLHIHVSLISSGLIMIFSVNCDDKLENMDLNGVEYNYIRNAQENIIGYRENFQQHFGTFQSC